VKYRNYIKTYKNVVNECFAIIEALYNEKIEEFAFLEWVVRNSLTLDGVVSTEDCMLCPITKGDVLPTYPLQHVTTFDMRE
jgi:hypothetical protein